MYVRPERVVCVCGEAESSEAALDWQCCHINPLVCDSALSVLY